MFLRPCRTTLASALAVVLAGCVSVTSYVEPGHTLVGPEGIQARHPPTPVDLQVKFLRNGVPAPDRDAHLRDVIAHTLASTRVLSAAPAGQAQASLQVSVDDRFNQARAAGQGALVGLTEGLFGKTVIDHYIFVFTLSGARQPLRRAVYDNAIQTNIGRAPAPVAARPMGTTDAYEVVVQQAVLNFLLDLQKDRGLPLPTGYVGNGSDSP